MSAVEMIRQAVTAKGWRDFDLAWVMGIDATLLSRIVRKRTRITARSAKLFEVALDISAYDLLVAQNIEIAANLPLPDHRIAERAAAIKRGERPATIVCPTCFGDGRVAFNHGVPEVGTTDVQADH